MNNKPLGRGPSTALSIHWYFDPAENVSLEVKSRYVIPREDPIGQRLVSRQG